MHPSTRFTIAAHILTLLAYFPGQTITSEFIAGSVNTNPVVIRRLLGLLRQAGFVTSQPGTGGGWQLRRSPESITLLDIRRAVHERSPFSLHAQPPNPACPVGRKMQSALLGVFGGAERALETCLAETTVASLLRSIQDA